MDGWIGAVKAVSWAIGHTPGWVTTPTQDIQMASGLFERHAVDVLSYPSIRKAITMLYRTTLNALLLI